MIHMHFKNRKMMSILYYTKFLTAYYFLRRPGANRSGQYIFMEVKIMNTNELDAKVKELRELRNFEAEVKSEITAIEDSIKAEMLARNTDELAGWDYIVTWKTIITSRFDSAAFKLTHADLFKQYTKATTSRRLVIA